MIDDAPDKFDPHNLDRKTRRALRGTFRADMESRGNFGRALLFCFAALVLFVGLAVAAWWFFRHRG
ncbi:MAG TPA: hypothetical protein VE981_21315 [Planctomycetota bacterium]|nr:hypothetical protein [Planctomycetota bacterium]